MSRLGPFVIDHGERVLRRGDETVAIQPKVLECIELLASHAGRLVTHARIRSALWPDVTVGDDAVRKVVARARDVLRSGGASAPTIVGRKGLGYVMNGAVETQGAPATSVPSAARREDWPMVGRDGELAALRQQVSELAVGRGGLVLISGEAGAGKTTLIGRVAAESQRDTPVLRLTGSCPSKLLAPAFWPFVEIVRQLVHASERDETLARSAKRLAATCARELGPSRSSDGHGRAGTAEGRLLVAHALCEQLVELSHRRPVCLMVEDLHWADPGSLLLIEMLTRAAVEHAICIIATYRPEAFSEAGALSAMLSSVGGRAGVSELHLRPLTTDDIEQLLAERRHPYAGRGSAAAAHRHTGGNALFARLLLGDDAPLPLGERVSPRSLAHVVMERVRSLPEQTRRLLSMASVIGAEFNLTVLANLDESSVADVGCALERAIDVGILQRTGDGPVELRFVHSVVCDVLYDALAGHVRAELHGRALSAFAHSRSQDSTNVLAWHAFLAGAAVDPSTTFGLCERAGRESFEQLAFERAVIHLTRALQQNVPELSDVTRAELALMRARSCWEADLGPAKTAEAFQVAIEAARACGSPRLLADAAISAAVGIDSPIELHAARLRQHHLDALTSAFHALDDEERATRHRVARTLVWMSATLGDRDGVRRWTDVALNDADTGADAWTSLLATGLRCTRGIFTPDRQEASSSLDTMRLQIHAADLSPRERVEARVQFMTFCLLLGDGLSFRMACHELADLVSALPQPLRFGRLGERYSIYAALPDLVRATSSTLAGEFADANEHFGRLVAKVSMLRPTDSAPSVAGAVVLMPLLRYQARTHVLAPVIEAGRAELGELVYQLASAEIALENTLADRAAEHFGALRAMGFRSMLRGRTIPAFPDELVTMADVCGAVGTPEDAAALYEQLSPYEDLCAAKGLAFSMGACARPLGVLARKSGEHALAERHFMRALVLNERLGHRPEMARTRWQLSRLLHDVGDVSRAAAEAERAVAEARRMGLALGAG